MKNLLLFVCLVLGVYQAKAQIIITGFYTEPPYTDAPTGGGYEYIQLMATEDITFNTTTNSYCVMVGGNGGQAVTSDGWAGTTTTTNHYKFNLTSGSVVKGGFFYVGNTKKLINGEYPLAEGGPSTDISNANWIRTISTGDFDGDDGIGKKATAGFLPYAQTSACGIAVFKGTTVTNTTVPLDAVFYGNGIVNSGYVATDKGYLMPVNNGFYSNNGTTQKYFGQGTNTTLVGPKSSSNDNQFYMMGGTYNTSTKTWTNRVGTRVKLTATSTLANIQTGTSITVLPVDLIFFDAKPTNKGIQLKWSTASEKNNSYFDILRSSDGKTFQNIGNVLGAGNSNEVKYYLFNDENPLAGVNYYKLNQVDYDGKSTQSKVVALRSTLTQQQFNIISTANNSLVFSVYADENANGVIRLSNLTGQTILNTNVAIQKGFNEYTIQTPNLITGLYISTLKVGDKDAESIKFTK